MAAITEDLSRTTYQQRPALVQAVQFLGMSSFDSTKPIFNLFPNQYPNWLQQALSNGVIVPNGNEALIASALIVYPFEWIIFSGSYFYKRSEFEFEQEFYKAPAGQVAYLPVIDNELHNIFHNNIKGIYDTPSGDVIS